jgi:hypothetical protein
MLNEVALQAVRQSLCGPDGLFRRPLYDSYGFARLPATLEYLLTGNEETRRLALPGDVLGDLSRPCKTVILLLVDGFGWQLFQRYSPRFPFLSRFLDRGVISPITAQFPSTTAAHMTTLHTGLPVGPTGIHEWFYYEPVIDAVVAPLLFSLAGERDRETLAAKGVDPNALFPGPRLYQRWQELGIASTVFQDEKYADSAYSRTMMAGARRQGFATVADGLKQLVEALLQPGERRYFFFYIDTIDHRAHSDGLTSPEFEGQVESTFQRLEESFFGPLAGRLSDAVLVMSADHGQVPTDSAEPIYLNLAWPELPSLLKTNTAGEVIRFGGSGRDLFLYVRPECLEQVEARLKEMLAGKSEVWRTRPLVEEGFFGPPPHDRLLPRLGDLVILPFAGRSVFWFEEDRFRMRHKASHGGLTPEEMDTGVYVLPM